MNRWEQQPEQGKAVYFSSGHWMKALMCPLLWGPFTLCPVEARRGHMNDLLISMSEMHVA